MAAPKNGRPTIYTSELADKICSQLADGKSMRSICEADDIPCKTTIFMWLRTNQEFLNHYEIAKRESAESFADEMIDIADDGRNDWMKVNDKDNEGYKANGEYVQRTRLRLDTRKWLASKLQPKKYGDKMFQETKHSGIVGVKDVTDMSEDDVDKEIEGLLDDD